VDFSKDDRQLYIDTSTMITAKDGDPSVTARVVFFFAPPPGKNRDLSGWSPGLNSGRFRGVSVASTSVESPRILLVEDDEDSGLMLRYLLELCGYDVRLARTGAEGLEMAASWRPGIVISDLGLPRGLDGYDVARALRGDSRYRSAFLVALSGLGRDRDKARARDAGFDFYLTKPVDLEALEGAVSRARAALALEDGGPSRFQAESRSRAPGA
jgi:CheY-like chemotaxis protein